MLKSFIRKTLKKLEYSKNIRNNFRKFLFLDVPFQVNRSEIKYLSTKNFENPRNSAQVQCESFLMESQMTQNLFSESEAWAERSFYESRLAL